MEEKREIFVYLAPHQDDELTNLGVDLMRENAAGKEVWCLLCTDGSSSAVRRDLRDGKECPLHAGRHVYPMDRETFSRAR
ncbi:MAG: PIG-L family deacetylase, partial [Clostridia bacterium]|nr:PIG-L family deacetylase [Clostridia bacterium]